MITYVAQFLCEHDIEPETLTHSVTGIYPDKPDYQWPSTLIQNAQLAVKRHWVQGLLEEIECGHVFLNAEVRLDGILIGYVTDYRLV